MFKEPTPSVTAGQIGALITLVAGQAVAWGWITNDVGQIMVSTGSIVVAAVWKGADAYLRGRRAISHAVPVEPVSVPVKSP